MLDWLIQPLQYPFMVRGIGAAVLVGIVCAVVGSFIVLRGMAFFGDALVSCDSPRISSRIFSGWRGSPGAFLVGVGHGYRQRAVHWSRFPLYTDSGKIPLSGSSLQGCLRSGLR